MKKYFYSLLRKYISLYILPQNSVVEINPSSNLLVGSMKGGLTSVRNFGGMESHSKATEADKQIAFESIEKYAPDYIVLNGLLHYQRDIQAMLREIHPMCRPNTRIIVTYYSALWRPLTSLASALGIRDKSPEQNWLAHEDIKNILTLEGFEVVRIDRKILIPIYIPFFSNFINRFIAPLPIFNAFCFVNIALVRPKFNVNDFVLSPPSVSIIVPARNEAGNIKEIINRIPTMGSKDEIIFVEGNSTDNTWDVIKDASANYQGDRKIVIAQQDGHGKGDAVRKGFGIASNEVLMILDADMTVPPEDLPKFYKAITSGNGEFINGTRLVYPMEKEAMRFFNLIGNKFFAAAFSFVLGQRFKDTLCGTKVLTKDNYVQLAMNRSYFGDFDPFGDFDLIFGAARMGLKIIEVPIVYRERVYGETNISRWRHGVILLAMLIFASRKIRFL